LSTAAAPSASPAALLGARGVPSYTTTTLFRRMRAMRLEVFALTWLAYVGYYLARKNLSIVKSALHDENGLSFVQLGLLDSALMFAYAVGQFVCGALGDKVGARWLLSGGLALTALCNLAMGSGSVFSLFLVAWGVNGLAQSTGWPGCASAIAQWFAVRERGTVLALWCTCYQVGPVLAGLLATYCLEHLGWRAVFSVPAGVLFSIALVFAVRHRRTPEELGLPSASEHLDAVQLRDATFDLPSETVVEDTAPMTNAERIVLLKSRTLWTLGLTYVCLKFIRYSFMFWLPLFLHKRLGYGASDAGYTSIVFDLVGIGGTLFAGVVSDRVFGGGRAQIIVLMMVGLTLALFGYSSVMEASHLVNGLAIGAIGFFLYGPDSLASGAAAIDCGGRRGAALASGFVNGLGSIGASLSGVVVGYVSDHHGWDAVLALFAPMALAGALLMATLLPRFQRRSLEPDPDDR
jgi:sugar phosphate permease